MPQDNSVTEQSSLTEKPTVKEMLTVQNPVVRESRTVEEIGQDIKDSLVNRNKDVILPCLNKQKTVMKKFISIFTLVKSDLLHAIHVAWEITDAILTWLKSPTGQTLEEVITLAIPAGHAWTAEVISVVTELTAGLSNLQSPAQWEGILLRLGAEIVQIIHGKKLGTIDAYIAEFQKIFVD